MSSLPTLTTNTSGRGTNLPGWSVRRNIPWGPGAIIPASPSFFVHAKKVVRAEHLQATLNTSVKLIQTGYVRTPWERESTAPQIVIRLLQGSLFEGWYLARPMPVVIEQDENEVLVSEPMFSMFAGGATEEDAIEAFQRVLVDYLEILSDDEDALGPHLRNQLDYLRSYLRHR